MLRSKAAAWLGVSLSIGAGLSGAPARAAGDLSQQEPVEVSVDLGKAESDEHRFFPAELTFETGKLYKLVIRNPSPHPHYFTSATFADKVYTRKVQVTLPGDPGKRIAEIKGPVREVEVYPSGSVEWWFVPVATANITDLHCHVKDKDGISHAEKGMTGAIRIN
jgi:uncharacterized cupredoxin-like copper-binding protein